MFGIVVDSGLGSVHSLRSFAEERPRETDDLGGNEEEMIERATKASNGRRDNELPSAVTADGWRYHHIGIPTQSVRPQETYLPTLKVFVSGFDTSPYGVQWMRFEPDSPFPEIVKTVPHVAFEVDDLAAALSGKVVLIQPNHPSEGVTVAMIISDGAPVELLEFRKLVASNSGGVE